MAESTSPMAVASNCRMMPKPQLLRPMWSGIILLHLTAESADMVEVGNDITSNETWTGGTLYRVLRLLMWSKM
ncbi:MAG: hypothetical protein WEA58_07930 [Balneolaceae bacterium]